MTTSNRIASKKIETLVRLVDDRVQDWQRLPVPVQNSLAALGDLQSLLLHHVSVIAKPSSYDDLTKAMGAIDSIFAQMHRARTAALAAVYRGNMAGSFGNDISIHSDRTFAGNPGNNHGDEYFSQSKQQTTGDHAGKAELGSSADQCLRRVGGADESVTADQIGAALVEFALTGMWDEENANHDTEPDSTLTSMGNRNLQVPVATPTAQSLERIIATNPNDILPGKSHSPGNTQFQNTILLYAKAYSSTFNPVDRETVIRQVGAAMEATGGRFLQKVKGLDTVYYTQLRKRKVRAKIQRALQRCGAKMQSGNCSEKLDLTVRQPRFPVGAILQLDRCHICPGAGTKASWGSLMMAKIIQENLDEYRRSPVKADVVRKVEAEIDAAGCRFLGQVTDHQGNWICWVALEKSKVREKIAAAMTKANIRARKLAQGLPTETQASEMSVCTSIDND